VLRRDPPELVRGDLVEELPALLARGDGPLVVAESVVFPYIAPEGRRRVYEALADAGSRRPLAFVRTAAVEEDTSEAPQELALVGACGEATDLCAEEDPTLAFGHWPETSRDRPPTPWDNADDPPENEPLAEPMRVPRFRDLKKNWENALARFESDGLDMYVKRAGETWEEYYAALAKPYEPYEPYVATAPATS